MQKTRTKIITALLLTALTLAMFPLAANASLGNILINTGTAPSVAGQEVAAGGNILLNFTGVTWSGGQFYLMMSRDGFSSQSTGDLAYTPTFGVANLTSNTYMSNYTSGGKTWRVWNNTVYGPIASGIAGGNYYIKAFDGSVTAVAVTDTYITVTAALTITPSSANPSRAISINGTGFSANSPVNITYVNPITSKTVLVSVVTTDANGQFVLPYYSPDLAQALAAGENLEFQQIITFTANDTATVRYYTATFTESYRGLKVTGGAIAAAGNLFGNLTVVGGVVGVLSDFNITGYYFPPGAITFSFDNTIDITPAAGVTVNATGVFGTLVKIPISTLGAHNITMVDANGVKFVIFISIGTSIILTPKTGYVGDTVQVQGYGFPSATSANAYNVTITWTGNWPAGTSGTVTPMVYVLTTTGGQFTTTFVVPHDVIGNHLVTATANDTALTSANAQYKLKAKLIVTPDALSNDACLVTASGTGFDNTKYYIPNIDNQMLGIDAQTTGLYQTDVFANATGDIVITFIDAGFVTGTHVFALYQAGGQTVTFFALFTVEGDDANSAILNQINQTVTSTGTVVNSTATSVAQILAGINTANSALVSISGNIVTIQTTLGTISTSISSLPSSISSSVQTSITNGLATISTNIGTIKTSLDSIDAVLGAVAGDVVTLKTSVGDITTTLTAINAKVVSIEGDVATIATDAGEIKGIVQSIEDDVATIQTGVGTIQVDVSSLQQPVENANNNTSSMSTMIYVAVAFAIIAAIAAVASILLMRKKIAS